MRSTRCLAFVAGGAGDCRWTFVTPALASANKNKKFVSVEKLLHNLQRKKSRKSQHLIWATGPLQVSERQEHDAEKLYDCFIVDMRANKSSDFQLDSFPFSLRSRAVPFMPRSQPSSPCSLLYLFAYLSGVVLRLRCCCLISKPRLFIFCRLLLRSLPSETNRCKP